MSTSNIEINSRVSAALREIGALMRDVFLRVGASDFCCGVRFARTSPRDEMPTPSSCCGVRV